MTDTVKRRNAAVLQKLSVFLNYEPDFINSDIMDELMRECGLDCDAAYTMLLCAAMGLDTDKNAEDRALLREYFSGMAHRLDAGQYENDPYYASVTIPAVQSGEWVMRMQSYKPYEAFVCGDMRRDADGRVRVPIGYFDRAFNYPAVLQNGREWMLVTPNEIETMRPVAEAARGRVLTFGLGLGYFAFMAARKAEVSSVTVVERDAQVISLFDKYILPQLECANKINVIRKDAFEYAGKEMAAEHFDLVFTDIWHDAGDGVALWQKMKKYEKNSPCSRFFYWIEPTLSCYMP